MSDLLADLGSLDFAIYGVSAIFIVKALVNMLKSLLSWEGKKVILLSIGVSIILGVLNELASMYPVVDKWFRVVFFCIGVALAAGELYDNARDRRENLETNKQATQVIVETTQNNKSSLNVAVSEFRERMKEPMSGTSAEDDIRFLRSGSSSLTGSPPSPGISIDDLNK